MILGEAVRLGHADSNPLTGLKLRREKSDKKAELFRRGDSQDPSKHFRMNRSGCRCLSRSRCTLAVGCAKRAFPLTAWVTRRQDHIPSPKGGEDRAFSIPMPTALKPVWRS